jgi:hypothetical protein
MKLKERKTTDATRRKKCYRKEKLQFYIVLQLYFRSWHNLNDNSENILCTAFSMKVLCAAYLY